MARLKDRQRHIPNGFQFSIPELNYQSSPYSSFTVIVNSVHTLMQANTDLAAKRGWPVDYDGIVNWVDTYNANFCELNGWKEFFTHTDETNPFTAAKPYAEWPIWAKAIALLKKGGDIGVGSTLERVIGPDNSDAFKEWYKRTFGRPCRCNGRKAEYDIKYRYE